MKKLKEQTELSENMMGIDEQANTLKQQGKIQLQIARRKMDAKLKAMKKTAERRLKAKKSRIMQLRTILAKSLIDENRRGSKENCNPLQKVAERKVYCRKSFETDLNKWADCLTANPKSFCLLCCNNEFGIFANKNKKECIEYCKKPFEGDWKFVEFEEKK